jgi:hypothetical protein
MPFEVRLDSFAVAVKEMKLSLFSIVADSQGISSSERWPAVKEVFAESPENSVPLFLRFDSSIQIDTLPPGAPSLWNDNTSVAVKSFSNIVAEKVCGIVALLLAVVQRNPILEGASDLVRPPCEWVLTKVFQPLVALLGEHALLEDRAHGTINIISRYKKKIFTVSTAERTYAAQLNQPYVRKMLLDWITSDANLGVSAVSKVTAGFDLMSECLVQVDDYRRIVHIQMPKASMHVASQPRITNMENGWFIEISPDMLNQSFEILRQDAYRRALNEGILQEAEQNARESLEYFLLPLLNSTEQPFELIVTFGQPIETTNQE